MDTATKERVTTLDYSLTGINMSYLFQSLVFHAREAESLSQWKVKTQKLVKVLKLNKLAYKQIEENVWGVDVEYDFDKNNHFSLEIDKSEPFRSCCKFIYRFNNKKGQKQGVHLDVFNTKLLTEEEAKDEA